MLTELWDIQYFHLGTPQLAGDNWRQITRARVWVHLPRARSADEREAWVNIFYVSVDKNQHPFLTQQTSTKVKRKVNGGEEKSVCIMVKSL